MRGSPWLSAVLLAGLAMSAGGCSGPAMDRDASSDAPAAVCEMLTPLELGPCDEGYFLYEDQSCPLWLSDAGPYPGCTEAGDGRCHQECSTDADCTDPCRPLCRRLGLHNDGHARCNRVITVCRAEDVDDCVF